MKTPKKEKPNDPIQQFILCFLLKYFAEHPDIVKYGPNWVVLVEVAVILNHAKRHDSFHFLVNHSITVYTCSLKPVPNPKMQKLLPSAVYSPNKNQDFPKTILPYMLLLSNDFLEFYIPSMLIVP